MDGELFSEGAALNDNLGCHGHKVRLSCRIVEQFGIIIDTSKLGAVSVGVVEFNALFWGFAF